MESINLFCLPFAGGSKYSYNGYLNYLPKSIKLIQLDLPGRGSRVGEDLVPNIELLVDDIWEQINDKLDQPYAIYGHSMGSLLGYLITKRIVAFNINKPLHLIFSGCVSPSTKSVEPKRYSLPKQAFLDKLREYNGSPEEILDDEALMDFFEPILRADFEAIEKYQYTDTEPFDIPITVLIGKEDKTPYAEVQNWQKETTEQIEILQFDGKHFFIYQHQPEIVKVITKKLKPSKLIYS